MDKKFLNKVLDQLVRETEIDYDGEEVSVPIPLSFNSLIVFLLPPFSYSFSFAKHCKNVYGLNKEETEYVWDRYRKIIKDKIRNNG